MSQNSEGIMSAATLSGQRRQTTSLLSLADEEEEELLPVVVLGRSRSQMSAAASQCSNNRDYLLSLQSFRFCLRSLPLIKQLSAGMLEQKTTISKSSHTGNDASSQSSHLSIIGH